MEPSVLEVRAFLPF